MDLPTPRPDMPTVPEETDGPIVRDLLDWLWQTFGFQVETNKYLNYILNYNVIKFCILQMMLKFLVFYFLLFTENCGGGHGKKILQRE